MSKSIWTLWMSDLHIGSAFALLPPKFKGSTGSVLNLNTAQEYLYENYKQILERVRQLTGGRLDVLGVVGDSIDGVNWKKEGAFICEMDPMYQGKAALELLEPFADMANSVYVWQGSGYHVGRNSETEKWIAEQLGAVPDPVGRPVWDWNPSLDVEGVILDVAHHRSVTIINRSMALEREIRFAYQVADLKAVPHLILRAHDHVGCWIEVDGQGAVGMLPMTLQNHYARMSRWPNRWLTKWLGMWLIELKPDLVGTNEVPYRGYALRFQHPKPGGSAYRQRKARRERRAWNRLKSRLSL